MCKCNSNKPQHTKEYLDWYYSLCKRPKVTTDEDGKHWLHCCFLKSAHDGKHKWKVGKPGVDQRVVSGWGDPKDLGL